LTSLLALLAGIARRQSGQSSTELRVSGPYPFAVAAINGLSRRHLSHVISVPGFQNVTDRGCRDRRDQDLRPAVGAIQTGLGLTVGLRAMPTRSAGVATKLVRLKADTTDGLTASRGIGSSKQLKSA